MTLDLNTGETKQIGAFQTSTMSVYMLALACHVDGTMYGISTDDNLYRIDKATAACTLIGATGVNAAFTQSMDFDRNTGILYWLNCGDYTNRLTTFPESPNTTPKSLPMESICSFA